jgi:hypothetical protein
MTLIEVVRSAWGFKGLVPVRILDINPFGNVLVEDAVGQVWRICPEELSCEPVTETQQGVHEIQSSDDWKMERMVELATAALGAPGVERCFCLKTPGVLGGEYAIGNVGTITVAELIAFSGDVASQIEDLPDGSKITFRVVD